MSTELFTPMAEIAGVFVGFGALIAVRSGATMAVNEINNIRWVVTTAIWVVVTALAPIIVGSYGITGHDLWLACAILALALLAAVIVAFGRTPENRSEVAYAVSSHSPAGAVLSAVPMFWLPLAGVVVTLVLIMLRAFADHEQPLYLTAVAMGLLMSALGLLGAVFEGRRTTPFEDPGVPGRTSTSEREA